MDESIKTDSVIRAEHHELRAALGTMLASWDTATTAMVAFMNDKKPKTAEDYTRQLQIMYHAATLGRKVYKDTE